MIRRQTTPTQDSPSNKRDKYRVKGLSKRIYAYITTTMLDKNRSPGAKSIFNSGNTYQLPNFVDYLASVVYKLDCTQVTTICAVVYLERLKKQSQSLITLSTIHYLMFTALVLSCKYNQNTRYIMPYNKIGKLPKKLHIGKLELFFLNCIQYNLWIRDIEEVEQMLNKL